ncbi:MAG: response regulator [Desulfobacterales bacterium]
MMDANQRHRLPGGIEKILVVDDEASIRKLIRRILESLGYTVVPVATPEAAIGFFASDPDYFDLVITDMSTLEVRDGRLNSVISTMRPGIPTLLHTGVMPPAYANGVISGVLQKPASRLDFACAVRSTMDAAKTPVPDTALWMALPE